MHRIRTQEEADRLNERREAEFQETVAQAEAEAAKIGQGGGRLKNHDPFGLLRTIGGFVPVLGTALAAHSFMDNRPELGLPSAADSHRLSLLGLSGAMDFVPLPIAPVANLGLRSGKAGLSTFLKQPWADSLMATSPTRFHGAAFVSTKPLQQRITEAEAYLQGMNRQVEANNPAHWQDVLAATGGKGYSLESAPKLWPALVNENIDVVAMLQARDAMVQGVSKGQPHHSPDAGPRCIADCYAVRLPVRVRRTERDVLPRNLRCAPLYGGRRH